MLAWKRVTLDNKHIQKYDYQLGDEPNLYMENGCLTKHPLKNCCWEFQEDQMFFLFLS